MLLNEFLKEHETVQELKGHIAALTTKVKELEVSRATEVGMTKP
jgi:hypothetical protein